MKLFTFFNIIAQPLLIVLIFVFVFLNISEYTTHSFLFFCVLQIVHFISRIVYSNNRNKKLSDSENIMIGYLAIAIILVIITKIESDLIVITGLLLMISGIISAITNYIALLHFYHYLNSESKK